MVSMYMARRYNVHKLLTRKKQHPSGVQPFLGSDLRTTPPWSVGMYKGRKAGQMAVLLELAQMRCNKGNVLIQNSPLSFSCLN